ncbi:MAG: hypothetical protein BWY74_01216 [Firmicutes bacterium ADurb.Bin419]|nr:MAG: hypothetical protein BWY74_01216 [Firmicutes bacterium ADurb.Bin419]
MLKKIFTSKLFVIGVSMISCCMITFTVYTVKAKKDTQNSINHKNSIYHIYDESVYIPEPPSTREVPSYMRWEPMLGEYISDDLYYDKESRTFKDKPVVEENYENSEPYRKEEWLKKNKNSDKPLHKAIMAWKKYRSEHPSLSSLYDIKSDLGFIDNIEALGLDYVPEMLEMLTKDNVWNHPLLAAVECITGVEGCLPEGVLLDDAEFKHEMWKESFRKYMTDAKEMVKNDKDVEKLGLFALPYIAEEIENGDTKHLDQMASIVSKHEKVSKDELLTKDEEYWKGWIKNNEKKITIIKEISEKYKNK